MHFTHFDLGNLDKGRTVEVHLQGNAANVYLLDRLNYQRYARGQDFQAVGGLSKSSPVKLQTPAIGNWHVCVDLPGGYGTVKTSYRVLNTKTGSGDSKLQKFAPSDAQKRAKPAALSSVSAPTTQAARPVMVPRPPTQAAAPVMPAGGGVAAGICRSCSSLLTGGKFCPQCGEAVEKTCEFCGTVDTANGKFCTECGSKL